MVQSRGELDLPQKAIRSKRSSEVRMQHLECNDTIVLEILCEIDCSHPAFPELAID